MAFDKDDELLMNLGYQPELRRNFRPIEVFGIAFSIMSLVPSIISVLTFSLSAGPVGMTWGWLIPSVLILSVGTSLAEAASSSPTSGGLYYCSFLYAPKNLKCVMAWLAGYANTFGLIGGICSINYGAAGMILSIPGMATDGEWEASRYATYGVFVACVLSQCVVATLTSRLMAKLQTFCIVINMVVLILICIAFPVGLKSKGERPLNSGEFVFTNKQNYYPGYAYGWGFILAWQAAAWTIGAFDSCIHLAEEASNAATAVPLGITLSIAMCGILGFAVLAIFAAVMNPDVSQTLETTAGSAFAQIMLDCLNKRWGIAIEALCAIVQWLMGLSILVAASRQTWSFSRDGALPFSNVIRKINRETAVPMNAILFDGAIAIILGLLMLINETAAQALFSLATSSNSLAWFLPIFWRAWSGRTDSFVPGPFYLGDLWSRINGIVAASYLFFMITVVTMFPLESPVTPDTMNYTCVINPAIWIGCLIYYFVDGRKWFKGPKHTVEILESEVADGTIAPLPGKELDIRDVASTEKIDEFYRASSHN